MEGKDRPVAPQPPSSNAWWLGAAKKKAAEAGETVVGKAEPAVQVQWAWACGRLLAFLGQVQPAKGCLSLPPFACLTHRRPRAQPCWARRGLPRRWRRASRRWGWGARETLALRCGCVAVPQLQRGLALALLCGSLDNCWQAPKDSFFLPQRTKLAFAQLYAVQGPPPQQHDEVDATPQEQAWRHDVDWGPHHHAAKPPSGPGPLQRAKDTAASLG